MLIAIFFMIIAILDIKCFPSTYILATKSFTILNEVVLFSIFFTYLFTF